VTDFTGGRGTKHRENPRVSRQLFGRREGAQTARSKRCEMHVNTEVPANITGPLNSRLMRPNFICIARIVCLDSPPVQGGSPTWPAGVAEKVQAAAHREDGLQKPSQRTRSAGLVPKHEDARHQGFAMSHQQSEHRRLTPDGFPQGMMRSSVQPAGPVSASAIEQPDRGCLIASGGLANLFQRHVLGSPDHSMRS
jgi:hypothetical protein